MDCSRHIELRNLAQIDATHTNSLNSENLQRAVVTHLDGLPANESILRKSFKLQILAMESSTGCDTWVPGIECRQSWHPDFFEILQEDRTACGRHDGSFGVSSRDPFVLVGVLLAQTLIAKDHMHQLGTLRLLRGPKYAVYPCFTDNMECTTQTMRQWCTS